MEITRPFAEIAASDVASAGGKGASLGELVRAGIPVPPGFVVQTEAFECFLEEAGLHISVKNELRGVRGTGGDRTAVEQASERIRGRLLRVPIPKAVGQGLLASFDVLQAELVAVRSSATAEDGADASWAGELESFLNVPRDRLLDEVRRCWASLFTPRALFYRMEQGLESREVSVAVVVQKMVQPEVSGVAFSVHPVTQDPHQLVIEAGYGLGEAIVSGAVTPDRYVVDKRDFSMVDEQVVEQERALYCGEGSGSEWRDVSSEKQAARKLDQEKVQELADVVGAVERHFGFPCDVEWAMEGGVLYVLQSRPITTLS